MNLNNVLLKNLSLNLMNIFHLFGHYFRIILSMKMKNVYLRVFENLDRKNNMNFDQHLVLINLFFSLIHVLHIYHLNHLKYLNMFKLGEFHEIFLFNQFIIVLIQILVLMKIQYQLMVRSREMFFLVLL